MKVGVRVAPETAILQANGAAMVRKPIESVAITEKLLSPEVLGVPEMTPAALSESPAGSAPRASDHA